MAKTAKILLIDDDADFVEATRTVLESKPYEVIVAGEGNEGLQKAREENGPVTIFAEPPISCVQVFMGDQNIFAIF